MKTIIGVMHLLLIQLHHNMTGVSAAMLHFRETCQEKQFKGEKLHVCLRSPRVGSNKLRASLDLMLPSALPAIEVTDAELGDN